MTAMEGYLRLGAAIVEQACRDALSRPVEVKRFFCDSHSIFDICLPTADGEAVYNKIMENYRNKRRYIS